MEKLIQYLNQHRIELCNWNTTNLIKFKYSPYTFNLWDLWEQNTELLVISKQYWFIKRLVKNNKIDLMYITNYSIYQTDYYFEPYECLIMELAKCDEPIRFLVSVLK